MKKILVLYLTTLALFVCFTYAFIDSNLIYMHALYSGFAFSHRSITTSMYSFFLCALFLFYWYFVTRGKQLLEKKNYLKIVLGGTVLFGLGAYPAFVSYDIFNYIATAKVLFFYHENPYVLMPIQFLHDPLLLFMHAANKTALYGFVWILLTGTPFLAGFGNFVVTLFTFKAFVIIFYCLTILLLQKMSKNLQTILLFALNPLVIIETLMSGHNDIVMIFFALFSFYLLRKKNIFLSLLILIGSVFIKYATVVLLPIVIFVYFFQNKKQEIDWENIYAWSALVLFVVFLLSAFREEIYPWYAQWFLIFALLCKKRWLKVLALSFSFSMLFRDIPFMLLGTYFGITPMVKTVVTFTIPFAVGIVFVGKYLKRRFVFLRVHKASL